MEPPSRERAYRSPVFAENSVCVAREHGPSGRTSCGAWEARRAVARRQNRGAPIGPVRVDRALQDGALGAIPDDPGQGSRTSTNFKMELRGFKPIDILCTVHRPVWW